MEHLVRVHNENDRQTLEWLRRHIGDAAIAAAVQRCQGSGKPYLSTVCRQLGVTVPWFHLPRRESPSPVAEQSLATIRRTLAARTTLTVASPIVSSQQDRPGLDNVSPCRALARALVTATVASPL